MWNTHSGAGQTTWSEKQAKAKADDPEQSKRFIEAAREAAADE
jgi:hypothetical protein